MWAQPRMALDDDGRYAPGKPDFYLWCKHRRSFVVDLLSLHRSMPVAHRPISGAGRNQAYGNLHSLSEILLDVRERIREQNFESVEALWSSILECNASVTCEEWHPCSAGQFIVYPLRDIFACIMACHVGNRNLRGRLGMGNTRPDLLVLEELADVEAGDIRDELTKASNFIEFLLTDRFFDPEDSVPARPDVFSIERPESYVSGVYNFLTTHPNHNPLGNLLLQKLRILSQGFIGMDGQRGGVCH